MSTPELPIVFTKIRTLLSVSKLDSDGVKKLLRRILMWSHEMYVNREHSQIMVITKMQRRCNVFSFLITIHKYVSNVYKNYART